MGSSRRWLARLVVALAAWLPSAGTLDAPWISDDALILGHVHEHAALEDWSQPQYGLPTIRFWRPLVSLSWDLQERLFGVDPLPFRLLNLVCHASTAVLILELALALGAGLFAALVAGLAVAWFPEQGGTVTWVAGRVDSLTLPFFVGSLLAAARGRPVAAGTLAFAAAASKETAFALPALSFVVVLCRGASAGLARRGSALVAVVAAIGLAFVWRRLALGSWIGGYPVGTGGALGAVWNAGEALGRAAWPSLTGVLFTACLGLGLRTARPAMVAGGLALAALAAAPLFALLADGELEETNRRTLAFFDLGLCLCLAGALAAGPRGAGDAERGPRAGLPLVLACALAVLGARAWLARRDVLEWERAARLAERTTERLRAEASRAGAGELPLLAGDVPQVLGGAYVLSWGLADRLREPFPPAPRPVWPARAVFAPLAGDEAPRRRDLELGYERIGGSFLPVGLPAEDPRRIPVEADGFGPLGALRVDQRVVLAEPDRSEAFVARLARLREQVPFDGLELVLHTELGHQVAPWPLPPEGDSRVSLMQAFAAGDGRVTLADAWLLAAGAGARAAWLELRAWRESPERTVAASPWIPLVWDARLLDELR